MEILRVKVDVDEINEVISEAITARMILFHGSAEGACFHGTILNGGVDTQRMDHNGVGTLSARYILEGVDYKGVTCKIFIENNAEVGEGETVTKPKIYTDSPNLKMLEEVELSGKIETPDGQLTIIIESEQKLVLN